MNSFRKTLIFIFFIFSLVLLTNFSPTQVSADNCNDYTGANGTTIHQLCITKSEVSTSCGTNGLWASNGSGTCTTPGEICGVCGQGPASNGPGNGTSGGGGTTNTGIFSDPNTYCANNDCGQNSSYVSGKVFVDSNGNGKFDKPSNCWFGFGNCSNSSDADKGYKNATISIDGNNTTTNSNGEFDKRVPKKDSYTVTLTLPEGYVMSDVDGNTATQTYSSGTKSLNFAIQPAPTTTRPAKCDPNGDGKQTPDDMTILEGEWFGGVVTKTADCNNDGVVNGLDFQILKDQINGLTLQNVLYNSQ